MSKPLPRCQNRKCVSTDFGRKVGAEMKYHETNDRSADVFVCEHCHGMEVMTKPNLQQQVRQDRRREGLG